MAALRDVVRTRLTSDATLMALLEGGVLDASTLNYSGESVADAPFGSDNVTMEAHAIIRWGESAPYDAYKFAAEDEEFEIYLYQAVGYNVIESAISRIRTLLHDQYLTADDRALAHVRMIFVSRDIPADELGGVPSRFVRFSTIMIRQ